MNTRISQLRAPLVALALLGACRAEPPATRAPATADSVAITPASGDSASARSATSPAAPSADDSIPPGFVAAADSVLQVRLARSMFISPANRVAPIEECDLMDEGLPPAFAATRARVLHDTAPLLTWDNNPDTGARSLLARLTVEITSVATLDQVAGANLEKRYDVTVAPRIDTAEVGVLQSVASGRWEVCEPLRFRDGSPLEPWTFVQASDTAIRTEKWTPATMSWSALTELARGASVAR